MSRLFFNSGYTPLPTWPGCSASLARMRSTKAAQTPGSRAPGTTSMKSAAGSGLIRGSSGRVVVEVVAGGGLDLGLRAEEHRHALVQLARHDVHDAFAPVGGGAAGLFDEEGHRVGL